MFNEDQISGHGSVRTSTAALACEISPENVKAHAPDFRRSERNSSTIGKLEMKLQSVHF